MNIIASLLRASSKMQSLGVKSACATSLGLVLALGLPAVGQDQFSYTIGSGAVEIDGYNGTNGDVDIPASINGLPVVSIRWGAFLNNEVLVNVTIPGTVTNLGRCSFENCYSLVSVTIPGSVATFMA